MSRKLWDFFDGEPFMDNPRLGILNSRKKKGSKMAYRKRRRVHRRGKKRTRRARRNPWPVAGVVVNPRRRKRGRKHASRKRRRSSARRNPSLMGFSIPPINQVLFAGVGFIAPPMVEGFLSRFIPVDFQTSTFGKYAVRIASVIGLTWAVRQFIGAPEARMTAIGGSVYVLAGAVTEFAPGLLPGMGMYVPSTSMGMYVDANQSNYGTLGQGSKPPVSDLFSNASGSSAGVVRSYIRR